ncbi:uncharacterized protein BDR25DRAFT_316602 [Lindgomyces ingoldianus]|uniref:Uncharacterized protein n=1 Tax=Lindgomyces ingoldianus TaxID=673940 RepID=A0ACB6QM07_9PLEO|nr:uncharacterized protein BDR25DRAFT_316602 [Lindgomyces ingoldianus]KAF2468009.1 hypothetical protein BDR25DRAFT_316602 [Lindgomyces ingoldianus]
MYGLAQHALLTTRSCAHAVFTRNAQIKRSLSEVQNSYDYVIIGGGASGLTVADRLSEDPSKTVLVVEFGYLAENNRCVDWPRNVFNGYGPCIQFAFNITTAPIPGLNNFVIPSFAVGAVVGGGTAINGMYIPRASKADYDAWEELGNPS